MSQTTAPELHRFDSCIREVVNHITSIQMELDRAALREFLDLIMKSPRIFTMGAGRSGLVARAFAMRLMHLGFNVYVVGESTTPAVNPGDLVVAISGSGETRSIVDLSQIAKELGAKLVSITSSQDSSLAKISDLVIKVRGREPPPASATKFSGQARLEDYLERRMRGEYYSLAPMGTLFELTASVLLDAIVAQLMELKGVGEEEMRERHAVLE